MPSNQVTFNDFLKVDVRVGRIIEVNDFPKARKPAYQLKIDFGEEIGIKKSSAQITDLYTKVDLEDKLIIAVVNFPPKQIANFISEVLVLGAPNKDNQIVLLALNKEATVGSRVH